ncbi:hypothetical protein D3C81_2025910 [compost metagenome]
MFRNHGHKLLGKCLRIGNRACFNDKAFKLVVIMLMAISMMDFMMRLAVGNIVFRTHAKTEQHIGTKLAKTCRHHIDAAC